MQKRTIPVCLIVVIMLLLAACQTPAVDPNATETPGLTATETPTPTATPVPTATPTPTVSPTPTATPVPTNTPTPTATPKPTATPVPTNTPTPTATPKPTATPVPTATPRPTSTPVPTATPVPVGRTEPYLYWSEEDFRGEVVMDEHSQRTAVYRIGNLDKYYKEYDADYNLARDGHFITVVVEVEDSSIVEVEKKTLLAASVPCVIRPLRVGKTRVTFYLYEMLGARYPDASSTERKNAAPGRLFDTLTLTVTVEALDLGNNVSTYDPAADGFPYELGSYRVGENVILTLYGDTEKRGLEQRVVMVFTGTGRMWTMFEFPDGLSKSSWAVGENACVSGEICAVKAVFNEGITEINRFNFEYTSISEVILPSTLKVIGAWAFCSNDYLKKIVLPEGLERIEESAFHEVSVMEAPVLPSTLTYIGDYAFVGGIGNMFTLGRYNWKDPWTELEIPKSVTYIGWGAFINRANTVLVFEEGVDISGYHREWRLVKTGVNVKTIFK